MICMCDTYSRTCIQHGGPLTARISRDAGELVFAKLDFGAQIPIDY
jgi:hypothetical protein